jgi:hypothetical protein
MPVEVMDDEITAAPDEGAGEGGEFSLPDDFSLEGAGDDSAGSGETGSGEPSGGEPGEAAASSPSPGESADSAALNQRIEALQRSVTALTERLQNLAGLPGLPGAKPALDPNQIKTPEELLNALNQQLAALEGRTIQQARMASSEARARGLLSSQAVGAGYDYDTIKAKHIDHLIQSDPSVAQLLQKQSDPALAAYFLGLVGEIMERVGSDPVKTAKAIIAGLGAKVEGAREVKKVIDMAARRGAQKVLGSKGAAGNAAAPRKLTAEDVWKMSDREFAAMDAAIEQKLLGV